MGWTGPCTWLAAQRFQCRCAPFKRSFPPEPSHVSAHLQLKVTEFGQLRSQLQAAARKQQGSLAVRDLSGLVAPGQLVDTENLTTLVRAGSWLLDLLACGARTAGGSVAAPAAGISSNVGAGHVKDALSRAPCRSPPSSL